MKKPFGAFSAVSAVLVLGGLLLWGAPGRGQVSAADDAQAEFLKMKSLLLDGSFQNEAHRAARRRAVTGVLADYDSEPRLSDDAAPWPARTSARVDIPRLVRHCEEIGANCYHFLIWHQKTDWEDFQAFVAAAEKSPELTARGFTVWVYLVPPSESKSMKSEPFGLDYVAWMENAARFSASHPSVTAVCLDDFYWAPENRKLFTRDYIKKMRAAADRHNPDLALVTVMYWDEIAPGRETETWKSVSAIADGIDGILYPYMAQSLGKGLSHKETTALPAEIERLRGFFPGIPVILDIYVTRHSPPAGLPDPGWVGTLLDLSRSHADGVALYCSPKKNSAGVFSETWSRLMREPAGIFEAVRTRFHAWLKSGPAVFLSLAPDLGLVPVPDWPKLPDGWNFGEAAGVAVDREQNVYIFHRGPHPLVQFDREGRFRRSLLEGLIGSAHTVRIDADGFIWVVDVGSHTVLKVHPSGRIAMVLGRRGTPGADEATFNQPTDVAVAPDGDIYVTDGYGNSRVVRFSRDGKFLSQWGSKGDGPGKFNLPHAVVLDREGRVYVADRENARIQVFTREGRFLEQWTGLGSPWGLAKTPDENLLMADGKNNRIVKVSRDGRPLGIFGKPGKLPGEFTLAHAIALGAGGEIYVAEISNWRVQKLVPRPEGAAMSERDQGYETAFASRKAKVSADRIRRGVYHLSQSPLPRRVLNQTLPGHSASTLEEADAWIIDELRKAGYSPKTDETRVQAFGRNLNKPIAHQYAPPPAGAPWYSARNIIAAREGSVHPEKLIIIIAHKDSQSWIASPGANDNAVGTCGALELAAVLADHTPRHTIQFIFCNEEHTPWTSVTAAEAIRKAGLDVLALINLDGVGAKPASQQGRLTNVTRFTTPEGERLADLMARLNTRHALGLQQSKYPSDSPGDDDGSFIKAGFPWSVLNIGSMPYGDPHYHQEGDTPDKVDYENARATVLLTLAAVLWLDENGRP